MSEAINLVLRDYRIAFLELLQFTLWYNKKIKYHTHTYITPYLFSKTRTCIITAGYPPMVPSDLSMENLSVAMQDVNLLYLDGYSHEMALVVAKQVSSFFKLLQHELTDTI
jgi:hypothetical protein